MRRALMLLVLMVAGTAAVGAPGIARGTSPATIDSAANADAIAYSAAGARIAAAGVLDPSPFLAAPSPPLPVVPRDATRAGPRPPSVRAERSDERLQRSAPLAALRATSLSRSTEFRRYSAPLALTRSGLLTSAPATAPPSFPLA